MTRVGIIILYYIHDKRKTKHSLVHAAPDVKLLTNFKRSKAIVYKGDFRQQLKVQLTTNNILLSTND